MQDWPLTVDRILDHAASRHGDREIVTRSAAGLERTNYREVRARARQVSHALLEWGVERGDRIATLATNSARHIEVWYGIVGIGAVCHTLNPRLHRDQLGWMIGHAGDRVIFADAGFLPLLAEALAAAPTAVERVVVLDDPPDGIADLFVYEELIRSRPVSARWGGFAEETACGLCYTSGTTSNPKGVLYSHRSNFLHTLMTIQPDVFGIGASDVMLPIVPMYHANAWGVVFSAPAVGAKVVLPGARADGAAVHELLETERVTIAFAVPTVWQMLLAHLRATGGRISTLRRVLIGGSACPESMLRTFHDEYGVEMRHGWGMTEVSPIGTLGAPPAELAGRPFEEQVPCRMKQGRVPLLVELRLADEDGATLPEDGITVGRLMVRGATVARRYFRDGQDRLEDDGYFDTGDMATIDARGYLQIVDRAKDVIKSGGEWISSIDIENAAVGHPKAALAAVIGIAHPKWDERPLLLVQLKPGENATSAEFLDFLEGRFARWWMPDDVLFVEAIPLTPTGKIDKKALRARFGGVPDAGFLGGKTHVTF